MGTLVRAWRGFSRNLGQALPLALACGLALALASTGLGLQAGVRDALAGVRSSLGGEVVLSAAGQFRSAGGGGTAASDPRATATLTEAVAARLAASSYVASVDLALRTRVTSPTLRSGADDYGGAGGAAPAARPAGFWLAGNASPDRLNFDGRIGVLVSGRLYTTEEIAAHSTVAVVHERLATANGLAAGSAIRLSDPVGGGSALFTVVGIYRAAADTGEAPLAAGMGTLLFGDANTIYAPYTAVQDLTGRPGQLSAAVYYLGSAQDVDAFRSEAALNSWLAGGFQLWSSDTEFAALSTPLNHLAGFGRGVFAGAILAGGAAAAAAAWALARRNRGTIRIMAALGAIPRAVALQLALETGFAVTSGTALGLVAGCLLAPAAGTYLLTKEIASGALNTAIGRGILLSSGGLLQWTAGAILSLPSRYRATLGAGEVIRASVAGLALLAAAAGAAYVTAYRAGPSRLTGARR